MFLFDVFFHAGGVIHFFFHLPTSPGRLSDWQRRIVGSCYAFLGWRTAGAQRIQFFGPHENDDGLALGCHHAQPIYIRFVLYIIRYVELMNCMCQLTVCIFIHKYFDLNIYIDIDIDNRYMHACNLCDPSPSVCLSYFSQN